MLWDVAGPSGPGMQSTSSVHVIRVDADASVPFHWTQSMYADLVCFRMAKCLWSGCVDVKAVGDHALCLRAATLGPLRCAAVCGAGCVDDVHDEQRTAMTQRRDRRYSH